MYNILYILVISFIFFEFFFMDDKEILQEFINTRDKYVELEKICFEIP